ncbi:ARM repeat superfamily protein [Perilla frutescens var. hirtella]|nr:ARM repeat superfamily protein [Perilla frutescens var. hirtella]
MPAELLSRVISSVQSSIEGGFPFHNDRNSLLAAAIICLTRALSVSASTGVNNMLLGEISTGCLEGQGSGVQYTLFRYSEQLSTPSISLEALQVLDECLRAISGFKGTEDLSNDKSIDSPFTSDYVKTKAISSAPSYTLESPDSTNDDSKICMLASERWLDATIKHMPLIINYSSAMVRAASVTCFAGMTSSVFFSLPKDKQDYIISCSINAALNDEVPSVRSAACRAIGVIACFPQIYRSTEVLEKFIHAAERNTHDPLVRITASWALANICDSVSHFLDAFHAGRESMNCSEFTSLLVDSALRLAKDNDKVKANAVRGLGNLARSIRFTKKLPVRGDSLDSMHSKIEYRNEDHMKERSQSFQTSSGSFDWLEQMVQAFLSCVTTGNVKVQWNVCHALSNLFLNKSLKLQDMDWASSVFSILLLLLRDSSNFKIRIQAAAALAVPETIKGILPKQYECKAIQDSSLVGDIKNRSCDAPGINNSCSLFQIMKGGNACTVSKKMGCIIWEVIEHLVHQVKEVSKKNEKHKQAVQLVNKLCREMLSLPEGKASAMFLNSILTAAENGISEIVVVIMEMYPLVVLASEDETGKDVFLLAATNRYENVFNLIYRLNYQYINGQDSQGNNLMHICGKLAPPDRLNLVLGAALQMQRELQWFKEMEKFVHPSRRTLKNEEDLTLKMLFTREHRQLKEEREKWMKETAMACNIAAALIATVMFTAALTVPGGVKSDGTPVFLDEFAFHVFAVSDAISSFTSITSLLMFLSMLTSHYAEEDFLYVLPKRLTLGLLSLFVSITFMLAVFCAAMFLVFREKLAWILIPVEAFASLPVASFVLLQFPLLVEVVYSTYGPGIFGKKS